MPKMFALISCSPLFCVLASSTVSICQQRKISFKGRAGGRSQEARRTACGACNSHSPYDRHTRPPAAHNKTTLPLLLLLLLLPLSPPPLLRGWAVTLLVRLQEGTPYVDVKGTAHTNTGDIQRPADSKSRAQLTRTQETRHPIALEG